MPPLAPLPIDEALPALRGALRDHGQAVVVAPPGSGKTTRVPPLILDAGLAGDGVVLVLQPRRVAARLAAARVAWERGVPLGEEVGFQVRFERRAGRGTRLLFLTEGLLLRKLQADPFLEGVGCVVLDELHERSLHMDLALALLREVRTEARPDLRLVAMSATIDPEPFVQFLGGPRACPVLRASGRLHPVEHRYLEQPDDLPLEVRCARGVRRALAARPDGHVLVFLPGVAEIERTARALGGIDARLLPLHGRLSAAAQDRALAPSAERKVVLATNIAETSVTLEGVGAVVDCGLVKQPRLDPALGLERLERVRIAADSADQRAGRAGRTGPGLAFRLWTEAEQRLLDPRTTPEIQRADLLPTALSLRAWGADPDRFGWFEPPPRAAWSAAEATLKDLGALDDAGRITPLGRTMETLGVHPRLARVVVEGHRDGRLSEAAALAAQASELPAAADRLQEQLEREALRALGRPGPRTELDDPDRPAAWLLAGFPDRVALQRRPGSLRYRMVGGRGAVLEEGSPAEGAPLLLAVSLRAARRGARAEHRITRAIALDPDQLTLRQTRQLRFDSEREAVIAQRTTRYRDLVLRTQPAVEPPDSTEVAALLTAEALARPVRALQLNREAQELLDRVRFLAHHMPELGWPNWSDLGALLPELCHGRRSFAELRSVDWSRELRGRLGGAQLSALEREAPERCPVPSGSTVRLRYPDTGGIVEGGWAGAEGGAEPEPPVLAARIQQLFGMRQTPRLARGRVAVLVHLLAPNQRPAQVTRDLESFWATTYQQVRKDLRGRYPKHAWPEDPSTAVPEDRPRRPRR
jgi:ATP-dependent helicase HrpB